MEKAPKKTKKSFAESEFELGTLEDQQKFEKRRGGLLGKNFDSKSSGRKNKNLKKRV